VFFTTVVISGVENNDFQRGPAYRFFTLFCSPKRQKVQSSERYHHLRPEFIMDNKPQVDWMMETEKQQKIRSIDEKNALDCKDQKKFVVMSLPPLLRLSLGILHHHREVALETKL